MALSSSMFQNKNYILRYYNNNNNITNEIISSFYSMPGTDLSALHVIALVILTKVLWNRSVYKCTLNITKY